MTNDNHTTIVLVLLGPGGTLASWLGSYFVKLVRLANVELTLRGGC